MNIWFWLSQESSSFWSGKRFSVKTARSLYTWFLVKYSRIHVVEVKFVGYGAILLCKLDKTRIAVSIVVCKVLKEVVVLDLGRDCP